jgi:hypothetical protein
MESITDRNLTRIGLVIVTFLTLFLLLNIAIGAMLSGTADRGSQFLLVFGLMLVLIVGSLACLVGSPGYLRVAAVLGVVLLVFGLGPGLLHHEDLLISFILELPAAVVLGGTWLMRKTAGGQSVPEPWA